MERRPEEGTTSRVMCWWASWWYREEAARSGTSPCGRGGGFHVHRLTLMETGGGDRVMLVILR